MASLTPPSTKEILGHCAAVETRAAAGCDHRGERIDYSRPPLYAKSQSYSTGFCGLVGGQECPRLETGHTESPHYGAP